MRAYRERLVFKSREDSQQLLNFLSNFGRFKRYFQSDHPPPAADSGLHYQKKILRV
jgi:hypothetical protein